MTSSTSRRFTLPEGVKPRSANATSPSLHRGADQRHRRADAPRPRQRRCAAAVKPRRSKARAAAAPRRPPGCRACAPAPSAAAAGAGGAAAAPRRSNSRERARARTPCPTRRSSSPGSAIPAREYARNRHNAGFMAVDAIHAALPLRALARAFQGSSEGALGGPQDLSAEAHDLYERQRPSSSARRCASSSCRLEALVVIHDEIDLAAGKLRVKTGGGDAGQTACAPSPPTLGPDYRRVRIGVGHPGEKARGHGHVLAEFLQSRPGMAGADAGRDRRSRAAAGRATTTPAS